MWNGIPKFGFSLVNKVYSWEIEVLGVPAEEGFPAAQVAVGSVNAFHFVGKRVLEDGIESVEVPALAGWVHERVEEISAVEGGREGDIFPKLYL